MENSCPDKQQQRTYLGVDSPLRVVVEGNIGSGKTTFLSSFHSLKSATVLQEPVDKWTGLGPGKKYNLLELMYENPAKFALSLQTYVQLTMLKNHQQKVFTPIKMMERSLYSARYCFVENLFQSGLLSNVENIILDEWFEYLVTQEAEACKVDILVYLQTDPKVALERVKRRARNGERCVSLEYLNALHDLHEKWIMEPEGFPLPTKNVLILNGNQTPEKVRADFDAYLKREHGVDVLNAESIYHESPLKIGLSSPNLL